MRYFEGLEGLQLAADEAGPLGARPVLLLHGGGQTRHSWSSTMTELLAAGYAVVAIDARGHGDSQWDPFKRYRFEDFVGDLKAILHEFSTPPCVVGASLGGLAALTAIGESADPLAGALVLVDITPKMNQAGSAKIQAFMRAAPNGFASVEEAADAVAAYLPHRPRPNRLDGLRRNLRLNKEGRFVWHWDPAFIAHRRIEDWAPNLDARLAAAARKVTIPTLLVRGDLSEIVDDESAAHFRALMPGAQLATVVGAGHMVSGDSNNAFNAAILPFLSANCAAR